MDINQVTLVGRLAGDVEYSPGNEGRSSRAVGRLVVNRPPRQDEQGKRRYDAIQVVAWGPNADNLAQYTSKGKELAITGSIRVNAVEPTRKGGEWKNYYEVQIGHVSFGRDSTNGKVMKVLQGAEAELTTAQQELLKNSDDTMAALAANPEIKSILQAIVAKGMTAPVTEETVTEVETDASLEVQTPFQ